MRTGPSNRSQYKVFRTITTRWMDNDVYGHLNNVAERFFVHVYVDRTKQRPEPLHERLPSTLEQRLLTAP